MTVCAVVYMIMELPLKWNASVCISYRHMNADFVLSVVEAGE